ncbi:MAG: salicylate synthase [Micromonosporaceae bacterium]|nr:salicylate synthase [Micromonosporaceae bacterium]
MPTLCRAAVLPAPDDPAEAAVQLARAAAGTPHVVYERDGTWHFATAPAATLTAGAGWITASVAGRSHEADTGGRPVEAVAAALAALPRHGWRAFGWAAFELGHLLHADPATVGPEPLLHLVLPTVDIELTPGQAYVRASDDGALFHAGDLLTRPALSLATETAALADPEALVASGAAAYQQAVAATVADIRSGLLHKAVLSRSLPLADAPDLAATYLAGRRANTPARSYLFDLGGWQVAGFSPETVVEIDANGRIATDPLAGTRARDPDPDRNGLLGQELFADSKEVHEHALSVRLAIDELAGVCHPGSVAIEDFMAVRQRGSVQHLGSRVTGWLRADASAWLAFAALFPAITVTGVPKPAALRALRTHEPGSRGLYGGAVLMAGADGSLDAALVLRTVFRHRGQAWLRAGAGIMGQSTPAREWEETCEKLRSIAPFLRLDAPVPVAAPLTASVGAGPATDIGDRALSASPVKLGRRKVQNHKGRNR